MGSSRRASDGQPSIWGALVVLAGLRTIGGVFVGSIARAD
jgi:hypothetical protein